VKVGFGEDPRRVQPEHELLRAKFIPTINK